MANKIENYFFLIIKRNKIIFKSFNSIRGSFLTNEVTVNNDSLDNIYYFLENFLDKKIIDIEKDLKIFIKKIYIIFESDIFFLTEFSIKHKLKKTNFNQNQINDSLIDIKNEFVKYSPEYKIIHMSINRYIVNGIFLNNLPENIDNDDFIIKIDLICINKKIVKNFEKIFSKYQISINKILSYNYLARFNNKNNDNIVKLANDNINGLDLNEVYIKKKKPNNLGFFEKFFNFFN